MMGMDAMNIYDLETEEQKKKMERLSNEIPEITALKQKTASVWRSVCLWFNKVVSMYEAP